ncbi:ABC transporter transmembrane domain-containing protein [Rhodococcus sp. MEB064]|uniref:ABC transporter transmembrane domain-containing protein n=1 Tax=Rhodococcus sp. MEB064 TaxID=1587522 RepID=UPI000B1E97F2|nr:ABC transporter ATP-binding protein [Rhodococcus sp. MEB064]
MHSAPPSTGGAILRRTARRQRARLIGSSALFCVHQFCETMVPVAIGLIIGRAVATGDVTAMLLSLLGLAALFVVLSYAYRIGARIIVVAIEREAHLLRVEVAGRVLDPRGVHVDLGPGELLTVSTSDAEKTSWVLDAVARFAAAATALLVTAVALLLIDLPLGLAVVVGTPLLLLLLQLSAPLLTRAATDQQAEVARVSGLATDLIGGVRPLRGLGAEDAASRRFVDSSRRALAATMRLARGNSVYLGVSATVSALLSVAVAGTAGFLALEGRISVAELITVVGLAQFLIEPLGSLSRLPGLLAVIRGSADRLALVLGADPVVTSSGTGTADPASISLSDIRFGPLDGLDLHLDRGEMVGVVPYDPADGDALAAVLSGQVSARGVAGRIAIGGVDVSDLALHDVRRTVLVEPHGSDLFAGTVRSNIALRGTVDTGPAVRASSVTDIVDMHDGGLDHPVTDRGASLSGGQRQRVALARALAAEPPVLVLHDPTTAVDAVTEHAIARGIAELRHGGDARTQTTIVITTSPALLAVTDRVVTLDSGRVAATGTHLSLAESDPRYRRAVLR